MPVVIEPTVAAASTPWAVQVLASGSKANAALVTTPDGVVLLDAGISLKALRRALAVRGLSLADVRGVLLTHEHNDHAAHLRAWLERHPEWPVYLTAGSARGLAARADGWVPPRCRWIVADEILDVGGVRVQVLASSHDAEEPVTFGLERDGRVVAWITDTGRVTDAMVEVVRQSAVVFVESNHDPDMLRHGPYPDMLKRRVGGDRGHLSNQQCARLLERAQSMRTATLLHRSEHNNTDALALTEARRVCGAAFPLRLALQRAPLDVEWVDSLASTRTGQTLLAL
jgi:phosphoribosyl 1,2-cyclic phosphodiesterase